MLQHICEVSKFFIFELKIKFSPYKYGFFLIYLYLCSHKLLNMSDFVFYIKLKPFVAQWAKHTFGNPITFPARSPENNIITRFIEKNEDSILDLKHDGMTAVAIPASREKNPRFWNHLPPKWKKYIVTDIENMMINSMYSDLSEVAHNKNLLCAIQAWCSSKHIDIDYANTIAQKFYRLRKKFDESGVQSIRHTKAK